MASKNTHSKLAKASAAMKESTKVLTLGASKDLKTLTYDAQRILDKPALTSLNGIITRCRTVAKDSEFLKVYLPLKLSIYMYGMTIVPARVKGKEPTAQDGEKLQEWLDQEAKITLEPFTDTRTKETITPELVTNNREMAYKFAEDVCNEFLLLDFVPGVWNDTQGYASTVLPEQTEFIDTLGVPLLYYTHGLSAQDITKLPAEMQDRYKKNKTILFNSEEGEHFKVLKRARNGDGYGIPSLYSILTLLSEVGSKQEGMAAMAYFMRRATRHHKLGHEIKGGDRAGKPLHFWNEKRAKAVMLAWENKVGATDFTSNFDHETTYPWPDLKVFDELAFKGSDKRLNNWGGAVMLMLQAKGVMPYLTTLLRAQATLDRQKLTEFLSIVIFAAWKPPVPITVQFSNMIFNEARLAAEMMKFAQQCGWLSATTGKEEIGLNSKREESLKVEEAADKDAVAKYTPMFDTSHGSTPALGETAGKLADKANAAKGKGAGNTPGAKPGSTHKT